MLARNLKYRINEIISNVLLLTERERELKNDAATAAAASTSTGWHFRLVRVILIIEHIVVITPRYEVRQLQGPIAIACSSYPTKSNRNFCALNMHVQTHTHTHWHTM